MFIVRLSLAMLESLYCDTALSVQSLILDPASFVTDYLAPFVKLDSSENVPMDQTFRLCLPIIEALEDDNMRFVVCSLRF